MLDTPVLLIIFNRPDVTKQVFHAIRGAKPKCLYIAADGPRLDRPLDVELCQAARNVIETIDWPCTVKTFFRDENRGCGRGPAEAITWFFKHVDQGIILEDDCIPDPSFFSYCQELLKKYRLDNRVYMISGTNILRKWKSQEGSYLFSYMGHSLGWATWRRAWSAFDYDMKDWTTDLGKQKIRATLYFPQYFNHFSKEFTKYQISRPKDVWDFQWLFARWVNGGQTIVPAVNLITNIGFNAEATHSLNETDSLANLPRYEMKFPLVHSAHSVDKLFDWYIFERFISPLRIPIWKKILFKIIKIITQTN